jgi:hypothetical protein
MIAIDYPLSLESTNMCNILFAIRILSLSVQMIGAAIVAGGIFCCC